jgi:alpha-L-rhamnosidase
MTRQTRCAPDATPITARLAGTPERPIRFRRDFDIDVDVTAAELRITALGIYTAHINGRPVHDHVLAPGWTSYDHRLRYQVIDVTELVRPGRNCIAITVAEGWYRGRLGFGGGVRAVYGDDIGPIAELVLIDGDHDTPVVATDSSWRAAHGPITSASLYDGEHVDARLDTAGWSSPGFDDTGWAPVIQLPRIDDRLVDDDAPPVRRIDELSVAEVITTSSGRTVLDFGQNISGLVRFTVDGPAGAAITLRHAEVLEHGELCTRPLRHAEATDRYVLAGAGPETYEPTFTMHGFRYVEVSGWPTNLDPEAFRAIVCHSDMERTGWFECSDEALTKFHDNVVWSMRGNFVDVPTDCPQRDERLGWTGDLQVFAPTACFLYDCRTFIDSWLADLAVEQETIGTVPPYVPWVQLMFPPKPAAAWADAAVVVPWVLYERFGDVDTLRRHYPSMRAWVDEVASLTGDDHLWNAGFQLGDWLDPAAPPDRPADTRTDPYLIATAYHAYTAQILARAAEVLGMADDVRRYEQLAVSVVSAFNREFVTATGRLASDSQTAYALALAFNMLPDPGQRQHAAERLVDLVRHDDYRIGTGFVGTPLVCDALAAAGHIDDAYHLIMQRECPSWLYPVTMGATTIWERWDSMLPDGSINTGEMTSFNHYALGAVADFLHRVVAGLAPAAPGYRVALIRPRPGGRLTSAAARLATVHGMWSARWERVNGEIRVDLVVPDGCSAVIDIEGCSTTDCGPGSYRLVGSCRAVEQDPPRPPRRTPFDEIADGLAS